MWSKIIKFVLFLLILMIFWPTSYADRGSEKQNKIDFWTNTIDEILIHFRYNKFTHELEMSEGSSEESPVIEDEKNTSVKPDNEKHEKSLTSTTEKSHKSDTSAKTTGNDKKPDKSVSSISENSDDLTAVKDDFIDIDLNKGLQSIDLSAMKFKSPTQKQPFSGTDEHHLSIDPCSNNCSNVPHIACGHSWTLSPQCSHNAKLINLNNLQSLIIQQHNILRNNLAGNLTHFEPAARMGTTQWHPELATYAQLNAMTCNDEHDFCHNTNEFKVTGQNLASHNWSGRTKDLAGIIKQMINVWYSEYIYAEQSDVDSFHRIFGSDNEFIAHFTTVINERNTHIGCGAVAEKKGRLNTIYFACNYARNNIYNLPVYEKGPTASKCLTGVNPEYKNLCSISEVYKYNL
ncbi:allergen Tab y 5.0101-like [Lucilia sericata]|uniref:allergen Tab y 5.0101-like n=1 Tax=Lucilia sericata TaxID=13632 RepID=UPI0018A8504B|nr:allergen Tab y 5.0101-like [Lucilia sericata]